jgi:hypothetical protein
MANWGCSLAEDLRQILVKWNLLYITIEVLETGVTSAMKVLIVVLLWAERGHNFPPKLPAKAGCLKISELAHRDPDHS